MPLFPFGGPQFGLRDAKVADNNLDGTFGSLVDVPSVQLLGVQLNTTNAQLEGDDTITATAAKVISATVTLRFGSISLEVLEVLTGKTIESSGSGSAARRRFKIDGLNMPYFAVGGKAEAAEGSGETHVWIPKCKIMEGFEIRMEYGAFSIPELTCMAVPDTELESDEIIQVVQYNQTESIVFPPEWE